MKVYAFSLGSDGLIDGARKVLLDFGAENGCDGMRVDFKGRLFLASRTLKRPGILVTDPNGKELAFLPTGAESVRCQAAQGNSYQLRIRCWRGFEYPLRDR